MRERERREEEERIGESDKVKGEKRGNRFGNMQRRKSVKGKKNSAEKNVYLREKISNAVCTRNTCSANAPRIPTTYYSCTAFFSGH